MKPRTKIQHAVADLTKHLPDISDVETEYAIKHLFPKLAFATKSSGFCLECGQSIDIKKIVRKRVVCDHCGETLKVEYTRKRTLDVKDMRFATAFIWKYDIYDFQVVRTWEFCCYYKKGQPKKIFDWEVCQNWYDKKSGKEVNICRLLTWAGTFQGKFTLRGNTRIGYYGYQKNYNIFAHVHYDKTELRPEYTKMGIDYKLLCGNSLKSAVEDFKSSEVETIVKAGYVDVYNSWQRYDVERFFSSLKICIRNNYKIKDPILYLDLLNSLDQLDKDLYNPHYVCPENLKKSHDYYVGIIKRQQEIAERERARRHRERELEKLKKQKAFTERVYKKEKGIFFGLLFKKNNIEISPLTSIKEFEIEGKELDHCVFANRYYMKSDMLVLSAKVDGKRIETIEVNLENFKIIQCRGYDNKSSKYHDEIMKLMQSKIKHIRKQATSKTPIKKLQVA